VGITTVTQIAIIAAEAQPVSMAEAEAEGRALAFREQIKLLWAWG
jgi:hypothetical protein